MRSVRDRLADIALAIDEIGSMLGTASGIAAVHHALQDPVLFRAVKNALTDIGEAAKHVPADVRDRHPHVDWRGVAGLRDIVTHQYFRIDRRRIAFNVVENLPDLRRAVAAELDSPSP